MSDALCSEEEFILLYETIGLAEISKRLNCTRRAVLYRRLRIEKRIGRKIICAIPPVVKNSIQHTDYPYRLLKEINNGIIIIVSDCHYWPGRISTGHKGAIYLAKKIQPVLFVFNGDVMDFPKPSRHPPIGWTRTPNIRDELETGRERIYEIKKASPKSELIWTFGNHDARFENKLAHASPEYEGVHGTRLSDHFPEVTFAMSLWVNDDIVIKHRFKSGDHAAHNNTVRSGKTMVTGHLHSAKVTPYSDYNGTRYGVDTGTLDDPYGPQFIYGEDNPLNHRSSITVLTIVDGMLLNPEQALVVSEGIIQFRGELISV